MADLERLARETCEKFLTAAQLKQLCRFRGFNPSATDKPSLVEHVAPRLLGPAGVADAMKGLEDRWLLLLHAVALAGSGLDMRDLGPLVGASRHSGIDRASFQNVADGLLNRGVVLLDDSSSRDYAGESRYAKLTVVLPEVHRPFLPPFPVESVSLGAKPQSRSALDFCRKALAAAVDRGKSGTRPPGLLGRTARLFTLEDGKLAGNAVPDVPALLAKVRGEWVKGSAGTKLGRKAWGAAAVHILSHLPSGRGIPTQVLLWGLEQLELKADARDLEGFCEDGFQAGLLLRSDAASRPCYRAALDSAAAEEDAALAFTAQERGIRIDLERSGMQPLLQLAELSRVRTDAAELCLEPDIVLLGRAGDRLDGLQPLAELRRASKAYDEAMAHVQAHRGKLLLHQGLVVLRVEDLGLRTLLVRRYAEQLRELGGPYVAVPQDLGPEVETFARKEGYAPRRVQ